MVSYNGTLKDSLTSLLPPLHLMNRVIFSFKMAHASKRLIFQGQPLLSTRKQIKMGKPRDWDQSPPVRGNA